MRHALELPLTLAPTPGGRPLRAASLHELGLAAPGAQEALGELVELAASLVGADAAVMGLVHGGRRWCCHRGARWGTDAGVPLPALAALVLAPERPAVVEDARLDDRVCRHPLVAGAGGLRGLAGVPVASPFPGGPPGALCVVSARPLLLPPATLAMLRQLGRQAGHLLALHRGQADLERRLTASERARRRAEAARDTSQAVLDRRTRSLATMSHDMRTPLGGIVGALELLGGELGPGDSRELLQTAHDCATTLQDLVSDTLDLSRLESGKLELRPAAFSPAALLEQVVRVVRPTLAGGAVSLELELRPSTPAWLWGDLRRVRQILLNLVGNAAKFTEEGRVQVVSAMVAGMWTVEVSDTGPGIEDDALSSIFEPFVQAEAGREGRVEGTGLGLSICRELSQKMGGSIRVDSVLGEGATFVLRLPLPEIAAQRTADPLVDAAELSCMSVLVADDDWVCRRVTGAQLQRLGMRVTAVESGAEALAALERGGFEVAFLDLNMPGLSGAEVAARWRAQEQGERMALVALTGEEGREATARCRSAGFDRLLVKPLRWSRLVATLQGLMPGAGAAPVSLTAPRAGDCSDCETTGCPGPQ